MRQVENELGEVKQELIKLRALSRPASPHLRRSMRTLDSPVPSLSASATAAPSSAQLNDRTMMLVKDRWAQLVKHPSTSYSIYTLCVLSRPYSKFFKIFSLSFTKTVHYFKL